MCVNVFVRENICLSDLDYVHTYECLSLSSWPEDSRTEASSTHFSYLTDLPYAKKKMPKAL